MPLSLLRPLALMACALGLATVAYAQHPAQIATFPILPAEAPVRAAPPQAVLSDSVLTFVLGPTDEWTGEATLTLTNAAPAGADTLSFSAFTRPAGGETLAARSTGDEVFLTQNLSQEVNTGFASACGTAPFVPTSYWRVFDLAEADLPDGLTVTSLDVGYFQTSEPLATETQLRLYRLEGTLQSGELTLLAETTVSLAADTPTGLLPVEIEATFGPEDQIAIEWNAPYVPDSGVFIGASDAAATRPFYLSFPGCFSIDYPPYPTHSNPWVLNVRGLSGTSPFTVAPGEGAVAAGEAQELTVSVDATAMPEGIHPYEVVILTNDPDNPVLIVAVMIEVEERTVSVADDASPLSLALEALYPNPFGRSSTLAFTLPEPMTVRLDVFDLMGRRVATLVDGEHAAGRHEATWNADGLAAGTYLVRMQAGGIAQTLRAVVAR